MKYLMIISLTFAVNVTVAQSTKPISVYVMGQFNKPILDWNMKNNPSGIGLGIETFFLTHKKIRPTVDFAENIFLQKAEFSQPLPPTDKASDIKNNTSLLAGLSIHPVRFLYFSFVAGPALVNQKIYFSMKPSSGLYLDKGHKWTTKISFLTINNYVPIKPVFEGTPDKEATGYFQVSIGRRLF